MNQNQESAAEWWFRFFFYSTVAIAIYSTHVIRGSKITISFHMFRSLWWRSQFITAAYRMLWRLHSAFEFWLVFYLFSISQQQLFCKILVLLYLNKLNPTTFVVIVKPTIYHTLLLWYLSRPANRYKCLFSCFLLIK